MEEIKGQAFVPPDLAWQVARNVHQGVRRINHDIARGYCESDRGENLCWVVASRWSCSSFNCYDQSVDSYEVQVIKYTGNLVKIFFFSAPYPMSRGEQSSMVLYIKHIKHGKSMLPSQ